MSKIFIQLQHLLISPAPATSYVNSTENNNLMFSVVGIPQYKLVFMAYLLAKQLRLSCGERKMHSYWKRGLFLHCLIKLLFTRKHTDPPLPSLNGPPLRYLQEQVDEISTCKKHIKSIKRLTRFVQSCYSLSGQIDDEIIMWFYGTHPTGKCYDSYSRYWQSSLVLEKSDNIGLATFLLFMNLQALSFCAKIENCKEISFRH